MRGLALVLGLGLAAPAFGQSFVDAQGGVIRWLDTLTGRTGDIELAGHS